jgi:phage major head subunit gpT-like protein
MQPTPTNFALFISNINTSFGAVYADTTDSIWPQYASEVPVTGKQFVAGWTGMMPKMRVWYGPRVTNQPAPQTYSAVVLPFEITYDIDRFDLDDDLYGIYYRMVPDMARQTRRMIGHVAGQKGTSGAGLQAQIGLGGHHRPLAYPPLIFRRR